MCELRRKAHSQKNYTPTGSTETIVSGVYYLENVDDLFRREYKIKA
jgi:hydroxymethylglutaryl-CoA synthase